MDDYTGLPGAPGRAAGAYDFHRFDGEPREAPHRGSGLLSRRRQRSRVENRGHHRGRPRHGGAVDLQYFWGEGNESTDGDSVMHRMGGYAQIAKLGSGDESVLPTREARDEVIMTGHHPTLSTPCDTDPQ